MGKQPHFFLLADGGECVECDIDEIADALIVENDEGGRLFGYFTSDVGVHLGAVWIKLQKYKKKEKGSKSFANLLQITKTNTDSTDLHGKKHPCLSVRSVFE
jgi:hypothetical protein